MPKTAKSNGVALASAQQQYLNVQG